VTLFDLNQIEPQKPEPERSGISSEQQENIPLAARMRPRNFAEFVGQEHLVGEGRVLRKCIDADKLPSMVFWGPPGSGKTTLAYVIASVTKSHFTALSAVTAGVSDLRRAVDEARQRLKLTGQRTILFIDEIHRFNKSQQDAVLPFVENGDVVFIGATTENPSFEVIAPLLSRSRVFTLNALSDDTISTIVERAIKNEERGLGKLKVEIEEEALKHLVVIANGDARTALNGLDMATQATQPDAEGHRRLNLATVEESLQHRALLYDKSGDQHYDLISALHKSLRGSDPDAALYWLGRMLEAGEDPLYIARRMIRFASEDVGMADPQALIVAMAAQQAVHFIGMPEGNTALAQAAVYLATAPKSNALYTAYSRVKQDVQQSRNDPVPIHLRNPVTGLMKRMGYGEDYKYAHNYPENFVEQTYLPPKLQGKRYYFPSMQGFEKEILARLKTWWGQKKGGGTKDEGTK
jgi:putative ATPase